MSLPCAHIQIRKHWDWIQSISLNLRPLSIIESCRCIGNGGACSWIVDKNCISTGRVSIMHRFFRGKSVVPPDLINLVIITSTKKSLVGWIAMNPVCAVSQYQCQPLKRNFERFRDSMSLRSSGLRTREKCGKGNSISTVFRSMSHPRN